MSVTLAHWRGDLFGGVTAAVVALPLALAFGVASGAGPVAGVYGAICVGFFAALFGGTPTQISGPTGPMTVVMAAVFTQYADRPALAFTVVMLAGLFQIGFGWLRLGQYITLMPYPVISGFMTGIGAIILVLQAAPLIGHENPSGRPLAAIGAWPEHLADVHTGALVLGVTAFAIATFTPARIGRAVPATLLALVAGVALARLAFPTAPVLGEIPRGLPQPHLPAFELDVLARMIKSALVLAFLGSIDSLLTSLVADNVTRTQHDSNRELIGQGIGNTLAGIIGALPGAGATMRTVVNIRSGGRSGLSGVIHALVLLAVMLGLGSHAAHVPHAVLAGILIKVGVDIVDWGYLKRIHHAPRAGVVLMLTVLVLTVLVDLITAVGAGVVMASLLFVKRMADLQIGSIQAMFEPAAHLDLDDEERGLLERGGGRVLLVTLAGPMSFGAANGMARRLAAAGEYDVLVLDLSDVPFVDSSASLAIEGIVRDAREMGREVLLAGIREPVLRTFTQIGLLEVLGGGRRFATRARALAEAVARLEAAAGT